MYCNICDQFFDDDNVVRHVDPETGPMACCPWCGGDDLSESVRCSICGKDFTADDLPEGVCLECLWAAIDYDMALEFMKGDDGDDYVGLAGFLLNDWFGGDLDGGISYKLGEFLEETFRRLVADEQLRCAMCKLEQPKFLEACRLYCLPEYHSGRFGFDGHEFAKWYARRQKGGDAK